MARAWKAAKRHEKEPRTTAQTAKHNNNSNGQQRPQNNSTAQVPGGAMSQPFADVASGRYQNRDIVGQDQILQSNSDNKLGLDKIGASKDVKHDNSMLSHPNYHYKQIVKRIMHECEIMGNKNPTSTKPPPQKTCQPLRVQPHTITATTPAKQKPYVTPHRRKRTAPCQHTALTSTPNLDLIRSQKYLANYTSDSHFSSPTPAIAANGLRLPTSNSEPAHVRACTRAPSSMYGYTVNTFLATVTFSSSNIRKWAVMDSGETGKFLVSDAPLVERAPDDDPRPVPIDLCIFVPVEGLGGELDSFGTFFCWNGIFFLEESFLC